MLRTPAILATGLGLLAACAEHAETVTLTPTLEDKMPDGSLYTASTQSFLRTHHWLETANQLGLKIGSHNLGEVEFKGPDASGRLKVEGIPLEMLVPRLHYAPASPPDDFDALNLMLAEYSRNAISFPSGTTQDRMSHFESNFSESSAPWNLGGDYDFQPNPLYLPLRVGIINNCLAPGLWEANAVDRAGEIYHAWYSFPLPAYYQLVAETNGLDAAFVEQATKWNTSKVKLQLDRLRDDLGVVGKTSAKFVDAPIGFSSQDSRRKLHKGFIKMQAGSELKPPVMLSDVGASNAMMSAFIPPGKYSSETRKPFSLAFLHHPIAAEFRRVKPKTHYDWRHGGGTPDFANEGHIEVRIDLGEQKIVLGNLPLGLLVPQEDYVIHGFGVGILSADEVVERRKLLFKSGPHPSYAYLAEEKDGVLVAGNSHDAGIEQVFFRAHPHAPEPYLEITISSFERIADLVRYQIVIPEPLREEMKKDADRYISPVYYTYRDDNIR